jgi:hypothetical protein
MDSLAANPSGSSSMYGQGGNQPPDISTPLYLVNQLKDREMKDFKDKANFMSDLSFKQDRLKALFDPSRPSFGENQPSPAMPDPQHPFGDRDAISGPQKADLAMKQQGMDLDKAKLAQQGKLGQEALDIRTSQEALNQQKSDSIHQQKIAESERKQEEFRQKMELATQALGDKTKSADEQLKLHQSIAENTKAFHEAEKSIMDLKFKKSQSDHEDAMKAMKDKLDQAKRTSTTTTIDPSGNKRTVDTKRGSAADTVQVKGKDGQLYEIPADKKEEWDQQHAPEEEQQFQTPPAAMRVND